MAEKGNEEGQGDDGVALGEETKMGRECKIIEIEAMVMALWLQKQAMCSQNSLDR